jgi:hypothetical protein
LGGYEADRYDREFLLSYFPNSKIRNRDISEGKVAHIWSRAKFKASRELSARLPLEWRFVIQESPLAGFQEEIINTRYKFSPYFVGYWGTYRYFADIEAQLRNELLPPSPTIPETAELLRAITSSNSCFIHWRSYLEERGRQEYLLEYYSAGIAQMKVRNGLTKFYVFSDHPEIARDILSGIFQSEHEAVFVDIPASKGNVGSLNDFYLMYSCKHAIIGDSSFSWWAAWLNDRPGRHVIAPAGLSPWARDWIPSHWTAVDAVHVG